MQHSCHPLVETGSPSIDIPLLLLTGFTISLGHCIGMCGPIQTAFSLQLGPPAGKPWRLLPALLRYHSGRLLSYTLIGAAFGLVGSATRLTGATTTVQGTLAIVAGALMALVALGVMGFAPTQSWAEPKGAGEFVVRRMKGLLTSPGRGRQFALGVANGFLPCGPVLAVALSAVAAAHLLVGMLLLFVYGVGTVPVLIVLGLAASRIGVRARKWFYRVGGVMVLLIALQLVLRGLAVLGALPHLRLGPVVIW
jgi:sulfite exporter TauE/SafE